MLRFVLICSGGAVGTGARYLLGSWIARTTGSAFPFWTLSVNVIGSFAIGMVMALALNSQTMSETTRMVLTVGILGGFTTYSAFNFETIELAKQSGLMWAALNVGATLVGCLAAGVMGSSIGLTLARTAS